jgi:hypothetical protein
VTLWSRVYLPTFRRHEDDGTAIFRNVGEYLEDDGTAIFRNGGEYLPRDSESLLRTLAGVFQPIDAAVTESHGERHNVACVTVTRTRRLRLDLASSRRHMWFSPSVTLAERQREEETLADCRTYVVF